MFVSEVVAVAWDHYTGMSKTLSAYVFVSLAFTTSWTVKADFDTSLIIIIINNELGHLI